MKKSCEPTRIISLLLFLFVSACRRREIFMNDVGKRLPPIFFDIVTSLASKPQYFTGSLTEVYGL